MGDKTNIKVLKNGKWINCCFKNLEIGDIIRYYDSTDKIIMLEYYMSEIIRTPEYYEDGCDKPFNAELILLSKVLTLEDNRNFIKSLIGKYASCLGRYQFKYVYKNLYDFLKREGFNVRKHEKPYINNLTKEELIMCEQYLRFCLFDFKKDFTDILEKYGMLANEKYFEQEI